MSFKNISDTLYDIKARGLSESIFHTPAIDADAVHKYNDLITDGKSAQEALAAASRGTNKATIAFMKSANGAKIETEQLTAAQEASTLAARAQSAALGALSAVGNMAVTALVFKGIELAATAVDQYVNRVKYAVEAMKEAQQAIMDSQNRLSDVTATIEENRDRFIELSEGVNKFSGNVSLSEEDYAEYLSISNTLAEISPDLVTGFTAQGDALLYIGDSAEEANEKLNGILESEQAIAKQELIDNMGDVANGIYRQVEAANEKIFSLKSELGEYSTFEALQSPENFIHDVNDTTKMISYGTETGLSTEEIEKLKQLIFDSGARVHDDAAFDSMSFLAEDAPLVENAIKEFYDSISTAERKMKSAYINGLKKDIQEQEQLIADLYSKMTPNISAWAQSTYEYDILDVEQKNLVDALVPNLDWKAIKEETGKEFATDIEYEEYIKENILNPLLSIPDEYQDEVNEKFAELLNFEPGDIGMVDYASDLEKYLSERGVNIRLTPLIEDTGELKESYDRAMTDAALKYIEGGSKNYGLLEDERKSLEDFAKENSINTKAEIEFWNQCLEESQTKEEAMQNYLEHAPSLNGESSLTFDSEGFLDSVSSIQSCYDTLLSAQNEYNEYGAITASTLKSIMDNDLFSYLTYTADGLSINTSALESNEQAVKNAAIAELYHAMCNDIQNLSLEDTGTLSQIAQAAIANLDAAAIASGEDAAAAANGWWEYAASVQDIPGVSDLTGKKRDQAEAIVNRYKNIANSINALSFTASNSARGSSKSSMQTAEKDWKEHLDQCLALYQAELDAGLIDFDTFLSNSNAMIEEFYRDGKISAKEYHDYVGKMLETQKGIYDKVLSAVTKRFDREIDRIQESIDAIEKQNEALEKQKDEYDTILSVVDSVYEKEIENIRSQQDAIQDTIDALQEENDERKFALQLEQAKWELYRAQTQRTKKVFNGTEFVYGTDKDAIRDAQETLADLTLEQTVDGLEKEKDALDAVIEELEYYRDIWNEISGAKEKAENEQLAIALWGKDYEKLILSNRLSDIESFKDNYLSTQQQINDNQTLIDSYNEKVEYYEALKESWNSITDAYETAMNEQLAAQVLGADWESQILSGRLETLQHFRDEYIAIQQAITAAAWESANSQAAAENAANTSNTSTGNPGNPAYEERLPGNDRVVHIAENATWYDPVTKKSGTGTPPERLRNVMMAYGRGTDNAREGYHLIAETGTEIIRDNYGNAVIAEGKQLHHFDGGETVFSPSETRELLSGELTPLDSAFADTSPTLRRQSDVLLEQWQKIVPDLSNQLLPVGAALLTAHQFTETRSQSTPVVQNITLTLPNVTNNSGYERIKKELRQMQIDAYQNAHRRSV